MQTLAIKMAIEIEKHLLCLRALKRLPAWQIKAEKDLIKKLEKLFNTTFNKLLKEFKAAGRVPSGDDLLIKQLKQILLDKVDDFTDINYDTALIAASHGRKETLRSLSLGFTDFSPQVKELIREKVFEASQSTMDRIAGDVMGEIVHGYTDGLGIRQVAENLELQFDNMKDWELRRIARTEVNSFQNQGAYQTEQELGIEYHQWWTADDDIVRDRHVELHGQIVKIGNRFSNGLLYPGDTGGDIDEWINCRCREVPFLMPEGFIAPDTEYFYEDDLIKVN